MAQISVEQFARELGLQPTILLEQLKAAGVQKVMTEDALTEQDKNQLLEYLRKTHGAPESKSKITLTHRQTTEIRKSDSAGRLRKPCVTDNYVAALARANAGLRERRRSLDIADRGAATSGLYLAPGF